MSQPGSQPFWKNKRVLITGADGFIGSHLTEALLQAGARVRALSQYNSFQHWGWLEEIAPQEGLEVVAGDVRDMEVCRKLVKDQEMIFHLAALISIPYSYQAANSYLDTNIRGTLHICQVALDAGGIPVLHTSSSEVYGTAQYVPIDERHPLQAQSPYSATKIGADALAMSFYHSYSLPVRIARPFNTYGPRQSTRAIIPSIITQLASGTQTLKVGDLRPTRDLVFVRDTCQAMLAIAQSEQTLGEATHIATGRETSMQDLLDTIVRLMGREVVIATDPARLRPKTSEVFRLCGSPEKLFALTGFRPQLSLEEGLKACIAWYQDADHINKFKPHTHHV
ncbi:MAG: SDR family NAD(P)-dependent oxidoreductase [Bacteroidota bacterium]